MDILFQGIILFLFIIPFMVAIFRFPISNLVKIIIYFVVFLESFSNFLVFQRKYFWLWSLILFIFSLILLLTSLRKQKTKFEQEKANSFVNLLMINGFLLNYTTFVGLFIGISSIFFEFIFFDGTGLYNPNGSPPISSNLFLLLTLSVCWFLYSFIPLKFSYERDFVFLFSHILFCLFVLPRLLISITTETMGTSTEPIFEETLVSIFLAEPLARILSSLGYLVWSDGLKIFYIDMTLNRSNAVVITTGCSGLYSVLIFTCAYSSFVMLLEKARKLDVFSFLILGMFMSYVANLIRMMAVILAGHYRGNDALEFVHANIGWIIFTFWFSIFWFLANKYLLLDNYNNISPFTIEEKE